LGYRPETDSAAVAPGETVALDFALTPAPVQLDEIVTTATGASPVSARCTSLCTPGILAVASVHVGVP